MVPLSMGASPARAVRHERIIPMIEDDTSGRTPPADTILGKILVGVAVAAGSAFVSWSVSRATYVPPPLPKPLAEIVPKTILAQANTIVEFSAKGSSVPGSEPPSYVWSVGGLELNRSPVARCNDKNSTLSCRFVLPGTFSVAVDVLDENGETSSAASTITVSVPGGYLGLLLGKNDADAQKALLYDIDWAALQSLVTRPIILMEPDTQAPVYAALAEPPAVANDPPPWRGTAAGLKVAIPPLPPEAGLQFEIALAEIGLVPLTLPFSEVYAAATQGAIDLGFLVIDSPEALAEVGEQ